MKRIIVLLGLIGILFFGCARADEPAQIAATTLPVYEFTVRLCEGTGITVTRLVTESVSCLHDYSLNVRQVRAAEAAELVVINGANLEEFMEDLLEDGKTLDSSAGLELHHCEDHSHEHGDHEHGADAHIWLSPENAKVMASNICTGLSQKYPDYSIVFETNLSALLWDLDTLQAYGETQLAGLSCRKLVTFHDGFSYFAESFGLTVLEAIEEESGSEASAAELKHLITLVQDHSLPAIFTETNGSTSAANIVAAETGAAVYTLDMAMTGDSFFDAMYHNIDTIREALG